MSAQAKKMVSPKTKLGYDDLIRLCLERGFFFPAAEIYEGSPAGFWDYGPLGLLLRENVIREWRRCIVRGDDMLEIDGSVILPKVVFEASGHLSNLVDPIVECTKCSTKIRADRYIAEKTGRQIDERLSSEELGALISQYGLKCPKCGGELGKPTKFNMMFRVGIGAENQEGYLRPETAQTIFVDFSRLSKTMRLKLPKGIAQIGRSFRNEIAPRQSLIRLRELVQAEAEVFFDPSSKFDDCKFDLVRDTAMNFEFIDPSVGTKRLMGYEAAEQFGSMRIFAYYLALLQRFYDAIGFDPSLTRFRELSAADRAFYTTMAFDFEIKTSLGWVEHVACNYRTDYDLTNHSKRSGKDLSVMVEEEGQAGRKVVPHVIELSIGIDRTLLSLLDAGYFREGDRELLQLKPNVSPYLAAVFPLVSKPQFEEKAVSIHRSLQAELEESCIFHDNSGAIGRRYRRMDQVGTPYCITVDHETLEKGTVTLRDRDSMEQRRIPISGIADDLKELRKAASRGKVLTQ